jgi:hypothetical protein
MEAPKISPLPQDDAKSPAWSVMIPTFNPEWSLRGRLLIDSPLLSHLRLPKNRPST